MTADERTVEERRFMHDLSTPLSTAMISLDAIDEDLSGKSGRPSDPETVLFLLKQARLSIDRASALIQERRQVLSTRA